MKEKLYKEMTPAGFVHSEGRSYFLMTPDYQRWDGNFLTLPVVRCCAHDTVRVNGELKNGYDAVLHLMVAPTNCSIEIGYSRDTIMVWAGEYVEVEPEPVDLPEGDLYIISAENMPQLFVDPDGGLSYDPAAVDNGWVEPTND